jgi:hypothetical protein
MSTMKSYAAIVVGLLCVGYAVAQQTADPNLQQNQAGEAAQDHTANYRGDLTSTATQVQRASELIGLNVTTPNNEDTIGEIDDLVLDAVSVGGFLGIGDKLVAVPWKSFQHRKDEDGNLYVSLDTTKEKLEQAPGFDKDNWPDFANPQWSSDNDRHYGVSVDINTNR